MLHGFGSVQEYVKRPRKYANGHYNKTRYHTHKFDCKDVSYILCITLQVTHNQECEKQT